MTRHLRSSLYRDLESLPASLRGEIIHGQLRVQPQPRGQHILASSSGSAELHHAYQKGRGAQWWILCQPEVHFLADEAVLVPDIAGWKKTRLPCMQGGASFTVPPDWICEVLSPTTESVDRLEKLPIYAHYGVRDLWLINPAARSVETYHLDHGHWQKGGEYYDKDVVAAAPFTELCISASTLMGQPF